MRTLRGRSRNHKKKGDNGTGETGDCSRGGADLPVTNTETNEDIYYFSYGLMVNPLARARRGVQTDEAHAALLRDHRLNFSYGGAANIEPKTGWEVYGVLMKCSSVDDWKIIEKFEAGLESIEVEVYALKQKVRGGIESSEESTPSSIALEDEGFARVHDKPIRARTFVFPEHKKVANPDEIPQERSLQVIASGMRTYGVDPDYINDEFMGVEFTPSRKPENYFTFAPVTGEDTKDLPTLSLSAWDKECKKRLKQAAKKNINLVIFRFGNHAVQLMDHMDPEHPFCVFIKGRLQGPHDSTWTIVQTLFDPGMPLISNADEVTPQHQAWAEDQMVEKFQLAGFEAKAIFLVDTGAKKGAKARGRSAKARSRSAKSGSRSRSSARSATGKLQHALSSLQKSLSSPWLSSK